MRSVVAERPPPSWCGRRAASGRKEGGTGHTSSRGWDNLGPGGHRHPPPAQKGDQRHARVKGPIIQSGPKRDMEGPRGLRGGHPGRPHDRVQAFQGPSRKPGPDQPVWPSQVWQDPLPSTQGLALKRPCRPWTRQSGGDMGHPPTPPRGWSSGWGSTLMHTGRGERCLRGGRRSETGGPERQGPRARAGSGSDSGLPSPPKDTERPPPAFPCSSYLVGFPTPVPKAPGEKAQVSLGRGRPSHFHTSQHCPNRLPAPAGGPVRGRPCDTRQAWVRRPRPPPGPEATPHLARAPRSPTLSRAGASRPQWTSARFTEEKIVAPRALWSQLARCWQSGDSGPDAALRLLPEDVLHRGWLTNLSSKAGGALCRLPGWAMASCQAQDKGPTFSHGPGPSWGGSSR